MRDVASLWLLRHGQSEGNVIRLAALPDAEDLDIRMRDPDVPLSGLGASQAADFGAWLAADTRRGSPEAIVTSPYRRASETADIVSQAAGLPEPILDERLRERDLGIMDLLTLRGFSARFPDEALRRERLGKFYYRPPGGESWVDVALRCRSLLDSLRRDYADRRILLVTHEVVMIVFRYLLESIGEDGALRLSREGLIANCSLIAYARGDADTLVPEAVPWLAQPITGMADGRVATR
jgi:2,3-bisphosphoglycerate-dependent phosphoglycerate mutase